MDFPFIVEQLHPGAVHGVDFLFRDDLDQRGVHLEFWRLDAPQPRIDELRAAWEEVQPAAVLRDVQRARAEAYPTIGDQLDALWKHMATLGVAPDSPAGAMLAQVQAVKAAYPKPAS